MVAGNDQTNHNNVNPFEDEAISRDVANANNDNDDVDFDDDFDDDW